MANSAVLGALAVMISALRISDEFFDSTTAATENLTLRIPVRKGQLFVSWWTVWLAVFAFGVFGTAMFAEPAVTEIEKVIGLSQDSWGAKHCGGAGLNPSDRHPSKRYCLRIVPRLTSGP